MDLLSSFVDFGRFPLSNDCISSSGNLSHAIMNVSTQSTLGLWQLLEDAEAELLGERDCKDNRTKDQQMSCWFQESCLQKHACKESSGT